MSDCPTFDEVNALRLDRRPGEGELRQAVRLLKERDSLRRNEEWFGNRFESANRQRDAAFALAVEEEQRANEALKCVALLSACLRDAEAECQEAAWLLQNRPSEDELLETIARQNHRCATLEEERRIWREVSRQRLKHSDELTAHRDQLQRDFDECNADREQVTADWVAACNERDEARLDAAGWKRSFEEEQALRSRGVACIAVLTRERDQALKEQERLVRDIRDLEERNYRLCSERNEAQARAQVAESEAFLLAQRVKGD